MITLEEAKSLTKGTVLHRVSAKNADGTPQRWRVNGKPKVWKTRPDEVQVPIKFGLAVHDYMDEDVLGEFTFNPEVVERAEHMILQESDEAYACLADVAPGQQFHNVKHMTWFKRIFIAWLEDKV